MKTIYIVEFSSGSYEDFRKHIAGVSETLAGANTIKDSFQNLLTGYEKKLKAMKFGERFDFRFINYIQNYNTDSQDLNLNSSFGKLRIAIRSR
jgi:hypothetical protein